MDSENEPQCCDMLRLSLWCGHMHILPSTKTSNGGDREGEGMLSLTIPRCVPKPHDSIVSLGAAASSQIIALLVSATFQVFITFINQILQLRSYRLFLLARQIPQLSPQNLTCRRRRYHINESDTASESLVVCHSLRKPSADLGCSGVARLNSFIDHDICSRKLGGGIGVVYTHDRSVFDIGMRDQQAFQFCEQSAWIQM